MRPNQQNNNKNRQRGRNNNGGRKHTNPLSRNYESNGPDVKVRGNPAHIAERYVQLARDAQASGDSVMAENYYQHAEHYFRIVSAAQPQGVRSDQPGQDYDGDYDDADDGGADPMEPHARIVEEPPREPRQFREDRPQRDEPRAPREERQPLPDAVTAEGEDAENVPVVAVAEGDEGTRRPRRPRRRRPAGGEGAVSEGGDAAAPELPAFLTAGGTTAAE